MVLTNFNVTVINCVLADTTLIRVLKVNIKTYLRNEIEKSFLKSLIIIM